MAEYIEREILLKEIRTARNQLLVSKTAAAKLDRLVRNAPAADVRENVRGAWKRVEPGEPFGPEAVCPFCGREVVYMIVDRRYVFEPYCPHCGAELRGSGDSPADLPHPDLQHGGGDDA